MNRNNLKKIKNTFSILTNRSHGKTRLDHFIDNDFGSFLTVKL